jgi:hypothetical protein
MLGLEPSDKVSIVTFGEELSLLERILLKSFREGGGLSRVAGPGSPLDGAGSLAGNLPVPLLVDALREDGTLAAAALLDGRPVAMMPFWIKMR